jgi:4-amino-4-deoxy-L-arabinose transferase-like glycosyltransferase
MKDPARLPYLRVGSVILAVICAFGSQSYLSKPESIGVHLDLFIGFGFLCLAILAMYFGFSPPEELVGIPSFSVAIPSHQNLPTKGNGLFLVVSSYLIANMLYLIFGETIFVKAFWLGAIIIGLSIFWPEFRQGVREYRGRGFSRLSWEFCLVVLITWIGFFLRYWRLATIPAGIDGDIASVGLQALEIIHQPILNWFGVGWSEHSLLFFQSSALSMRIFGETLAGLMIGSVIIGTLCIPAVYLLGEELFGKKTGLIAAFLIAVSYTNIQFSRTVFTEGASLCLIVMAYALFKAFRSGKSVWYSLAGFFLGIGLFAYYSFRIAPLLVILLFVWLIFRDRKAVAGNYPNWKAFAAASLVGFGPQLVFTFKQFGTFVGRGNVVTIFNPEVSHHLLGKYQITNTTQLLLEQIKRTFLVYSNYGDSSPLFGYQGPMINLLTALFFILGIAYCLSRLKDVRHFVLIAWIALALILGGVITNDPPYWPHLAITLPAVMVLAGYAIVLCWSSFSTFLLKPVRVIFAIGLAAILISTGIKNWQTYFGYVQDNAGPRVRIARFLSSLSSNYQAYMISGDFQWQDREFQFLNQGMQADDLVLGQSFANNPPQVNIPTAFILTADRFSALPILQRLYPHGIIQDHIDSTGSLVFKSYIVEPANYQPQTSQVRTPIQNWLIPALIGLGVTAYFALLIYYFRNKLRARTKRRNQQINPSPLAMAITPTLHPDPVTYGMTNSVLPLPVVSQPFPIMLNENPGDPLTQTALDLARNTQTNSYPIRSMYHCIIKWSGFGPSIALATVFIGQMVLDVNTTGELGVTYRWLTGMAESTRVWIGLCVLILGFLFWLLFTPPFKETQQRDILPIVNKEEVVQFSWGEMFTVKPIFSSQMLIALTAWGGILCYCVSLVLFIIQGENWVVRYFWIAGVGIFIASQLLGWIYNHSKKPKRIAWQVRSISPFFLLLFIFAAGLVLRVYRLAEIPSDFHGDMASHGLMARDILFGNVTQIFHDGWASIPNMAFIPAAISLKIFGNNLYGLQMTSVIGGMVCLVGFYLLALRLFEKQRIALLSTALLAFNIPLIHFSRIAEYIDPWAFILPGLFLTVEAIKSKQPGCFGLAGICFGFGIQMYYSGRVILIILGALFLFLLVFERAWLQTNWQNASWLAVGLLIALGPSLIFFATHRDALIARSRDVWLFTPDIMRHLRNKYAVNSVWGVVMEQMRRSVLMFNHAIDSSTQFGYPHPLFSSYISPFIVVGLAIALKLWRKWEMMLLIIWVGAMMVFGSILTVDAPFWPRLVGIIPVAALFASICIDHLLNRLEKSLQQPSPKWINLALIALVITLGWRDWGIYYKTVENNARPQARIGRYLDSLPDQVAACGFTDPYELNVRETYFQAWPRKVVDIQETGFEVDLSTCPQAPVVWILSENHLDQMSRIASIYPGGILEEHRDENGVLVFTSYFVTGANTKL